MLLHQPVTTNDIIHKPACSFDNYEKSSLFFFCRLARHILHVNMLEEVQVENWMGSFLILLFLDYVRGGAAGESVIF